MVLVDDTLIRTTLDAAWYTFIPFFKKATGPMIAEAYIQAFRAAEAGDVPIQLIYQLADEHAVRLGKYFHDTSTTALAEGFNRMVNRQIPQKVAMQRVLLAYGLTPRQMSGYIAAKELQPSKIESALPQRLQRKVKAYIAESLARRFKIFGEQEKHNISEQAKQFAWMWMQEKGQLPVYAEKQWLTAKDEKVCEVCGPMNAVKVGIREHFELPNGAELYTPGAHVNCRCEIRLLLPPFKLISKADWDPMEHPRGGNPTNRGQFSSKPRPPRLRTLERIDDETVQRLRAEQRENAARAAALLEERKALVEAKKKPTLTPVEAPIISGPDTSVLSAPVLSSKTVLRPKTNVLADIKTETKVSAPEAVLSPVDVSLAPPDVLTRLAEPKVELSLDVKTKLAEALKNDLKTEAPPLAEPYYLDAYSIPGGKTVYLLGDSQWMEHPHADDRKAWVSEEEIWTTDENLVIGIAIAQLDSEIDQQTAEVVEDNGGVRADGFVHLKDQKTGMRFITTKDRIRQAMESLAYGGYGEVNEEDEVDGWWVDSSIGRPVDRKPMTYAEMQEGFGIGAEAFTQTIYSIKRGNSGEVEKLQSNQLGYGDGAEEWRVWGELRVKKDKGPRESLSNLPFRRVRLDTSANPMPYGQ